MVRMAIMMGKKKMVMQQLGRMNRKRLLRRGRRRDTDEPTVPAAGAGIAAAIVILAVTCASKF
jgi:hypothetical protein